MDRLWFVLPIVGALVAVTAVTFPMWALVGYPTEAIPVNSVPETADPIPVDDLDPESAALVERAIEADGEISVYGRGHTEDRNRAGLPSIVSEHRLDDRTFGAYVTHDSRVYEIASSEREPPSQFPVVATGMVTGFLFVGAGFEADRREWDRRPIFVLAGTGLLVVLAIAWFGNVTGYL